MRKVLSTLAALALMAITLLGSAAVSAEDAATPATPTDITTVRQTPLITELNAIAEELAEDETETLFEIEAGGERGDYLPYGEGTEAQMFQLYGGDYQGKNTVSVELASSELFSPLMFKVDSTETEPFSEANNIWLKFFTDDNTEAGAISLEDAAGILWYVKTPARKLRAQFPTWDPQEDWSIGPNKTNGAYVLKKDAKEWTTISCAGEYFNFAAADDEDYEGFEGFIFLPREYWTQSIEWDEVSLKDVSIIPGEYGGEAGPLYFSAPMVLLNDPTKAEYYPTRAKLEGEEITRYFFYGEKIDAPDPEETIDGVSYMTEIPFMEAYTVGEQIPEGETDGLYMVFPAPKFPRDTFDIKAVENPNPLGAAYNGFYVNNESEITNNVYGKGPKLELTIFSFEKFTIRDKGGFMFYVKMPKGQNGLDTTDIKLSLCINAESTATKSWPEVGKGDAYLLAKGSQEWTTTRCGNSSVPMPSGFEGWVRIPWSIMTGNGGVVPGDVVCNLIIYITSFGGEMGSFTISSLMQATNDVMSKDGVVLNGSGKIQNLFTGAEMTKEDLEGSGNEPGGNEPGGNEPGGNEPGGNEPGGNEPGGNEPGGNEPGGNEPGGNEPGGSDDVNSPDTGESSGLLAVMALAGVSSATAVILRKKRCGRRA